MYVSGTAKATEPNEPKARKMIEIGHNRRRANPTRLSYLFSADYERKTGCFWEDVCVLWFSAISLRPSAFGLQLSAFSFQPSAFSLQLSAVCNERFEGTRDGRAP
jgi:hypothetical protein